MDSRWVLEIIERWYHWVDWVLISNIKSLPVIFTKPSICWHKQWLKQQMLTLKNTKQLISNPYGGNRLQNHDLTKWQTMTPHCSIALEQNWFDHSAEILSLSRMRHYDFKRFQTTKFESHCQVYWTKSNSFKLLTFLIAKLVSKVS